jgi:hypothetical protein
MVAVIVFLLMLLSAVFFGLILSVDLDYYNMFALHLFYVCIILSLIFATLIQAVERYLVASAAYLLALFALILYQAPDSYLWFEDGFDPWLGKAGILAVLIICRLMIMVTKMVKRNR